MKQTAGNKIKLGVLVSAGIALFIICIYAIGNRQHLFGSTFRVSCIFKDVGGLQVGNNVRFSGINVGIVDDIVQVTDSTVRVDMQVEDHVRKFIKSSARTSIGSDGLMGNKIVLILPGNGTGAAVKDGDVIAAIQPVTFDDILESIKVTTDNSASITGDLAAITDNIRQGRGTIGKLFMDSTMAENVDQAMVNIRQGAGGFKRNMNAASHNILLRGYFKKKDKTGPEEEKSPEKK